MIFPRYFAGLPSQSPSVSLLGVIVLMNAMRSTRLTMVASERSSGVPMPNSKSPALVRKLSTKKRVMSDSMAMIVRMSKYFLWRGCDSCCLTPFQCLKRSTMNQTIPYVAAAGTKFTRNVIPTCESGIQNPMSEPTEAIVFTSPPPHCPAKKNENPRIPKMSSPVMLSASGCQELRVTEAIADNPMPAARNV